MERSYVLAQAGTRLRDVLRREVAGAGLAEEIQPIIIEREGRIVGLVPPRSGLWRQAAQDPDAVIDDFAEREIVLARDIDLLSLVFSRLKRHRAGAAIVFHGTERPRVKDIVGVITTRALAEAVIEGQDG
jgi:CIC family chloride channel protein